MVEKPGLPEAYADKFRENLDILLPPDDPAREQLKQKPLVGIPIAFLELASLEKFALHEAKDAGWLVMTMTDDGVVYGGEILTGQNGLEMGGLWRDPALPVLLKQLNKIVNLDQLKSEAALLQSNGTLRVKLLSIPAVLSDALWIYSGTKQYLVPVRIQGEIVSQVQVLEVEQVFKQLAEAAAAFRGFDELPEGSLAN